jgi:hypothetical protein
VAAAAAIGGAVAGCTAAADVLLLMLWPLAAAFVAAAALHKFQLRCLAATWRLIRGKEKVCGQDGESKDVKNLPTCCVSYPYVAMARQVCIDACMMIYVLAGSYNNAGVRGFRGLL